VLVVEFLEGADWLDIDADGDTDCGELAGAGRFETRRQVNTSVKHDFISIFPGLCHSNSGPTKAIYDEQRLKRTHPSLRNVDPSAVHLAF
jgi:hypothetical protein